MPKLNIARSSHKLTLSTETLLRLDATIVGTGHAAPSATQRTCAGNSCPPCAPEDGAAARRP